jgi:pimeloyl-ACP methyl ester carboxylesterase
MEATQQQQQQQQQQQHPNEQKQYTGDVLFIGGMNSEYLKPTEHLPIILEIFPNAELKMIEGAGHNVHYEKPNEFINVLKPFLTQSSPSSSSSSSTFKTSPIITKK